MTPPRIEPPTEPRRTLPPLPSLPRVLAVPPAVRRVETEYFRRLFISVGLSILLNLLLLALVSSTGLSQLLRLSERPKPKGQREAPKLVLVPKPPPTPPAPEMPKPKTFLETDASQASSEKPKNAEFYSEHNTVATQVAPSPIRPGDVPKADGPGIKSLATESVHPGPRSPPPSPPTHPTPSPVSKASAASPTPVPPSPPPLPTPPPLRSPPSKEGDLALLRREPPPKPPTKADAVAKSPEEPSSPPSVARVPPAPAAPALPSSEREVLAVKSKLDGGVGRTGRALAFGSTESPFASYDKRAIAKIGANWNFLLESRFYGETVGQVIISFKLLASGRVGEVRVEHNTANAVLANYCVQAIEKSAPFAPFPDALKALVGDSRDATITFNY
ncbi:MAG: energy transducer TonB [Verrucomicrobiae bacterium]|nr:energy transducer TonB [Verrucomicrobiae bacterium]